MFIQLRVELFNKWWWFEWTEMLNLEYVHIVKGINWNHYLQKHILKILIMNFHYMNVIVVH